MTKVDVSNGIHTVSLDELPPGYEWSLSELENDGDPVYVQWATLSIYRVAYGRRKRHLVTEMRGTLWPGDSVQSLASSMSTILRDRSAWEDRQPLPMRTRKQMSKSGVVFPSIEGVDPDKRRLSILLRQWSFYAFGIQGVFALFALVVIRQDFMALGFALPLPLYLLTYGIVSVWQYRKLSYTSLTMSGKKESTK